MSALAGRHGLPAALRAAVALLLLLLVAGCTAGHGDPPEVVALDQAEAILAPDGLPVERRTLNLRERWDLLFPGRGGHATYRVELPPHRGSVPMALLFTRVGNQVQVRINGTPLAEFGRPGDTYHDASKAAQLVRVPAAALRADATNLLEVETVVQRQRWGGLSVMRYGPQVLLEPQHAWLRFWRQGASTMFAASLAVMGGLAAVLWWRQREALYGCFSLAAWLGTVRNVDLIWTDLPAPWPWWGALAVACYIAHLALICRFTLIALGPVPPAMRLANTLAIVAGTALGTLSFALASPGLYTLGLALLVPLAVVTVGFIVRDAWRSRRPVAWVLVAAGVLGVLAGVHDLVFVRASHSTGLRIGWTPHAMFTFVVIMAGMVAERYSRYVSDFRALNADLSRRVAEREAELQQTFEALQAQRREQAVALERQRLMREIHDGVGSHLVGLLNMVHQREASPQLLEEQVRMALDEMRIAVDSLQPVHGDLATVLATLRYRLQPRLQAAGIRLDWDVLALPSLPQLSPQSVMQVQRILLEAFTNVLKHARASGIAVHARCEDPRAGHIELTLVDDGVGLTDEALDARGHGLANMRARAASIGAQLEVARAGPEGGTRITLRWPVGQVAA